MILCGARFSPSGFRCLPRRLRLFFSLKTSLFSQPVSFLPSAPSACPFFQNTNTARFCKIFRPFCFRRLRDFCGVLILAYFISPLSSLVGQSVEISAYTTDEVSFEHDYTEIPAKAEIKLGQSSRTADFIIYCDEPINLEPYDSFVCTVNISGLSTGRSHSAFSPVILTGGCESLDVTERSRKICGIIRFCAAAKSPSRSPLCFPMRFPRCYAAFP